jgi:hypothetical protein
MNLNKFKISKVIENQPGIMRGINNKRKSKAKEAPPGIINKTNRLRVKEEVPEINTKENLHNDSKPLNP